MRLLQITDIHIGAPGEDTFGADVRRNFSFLVEEAIRYAPDHLLLTGDLCYQKGHPDIYRWIKESLAGINCPVWVIPGNHDVPEMMTRTFGQTFPYRHHWSGQPALFLDTSSGYLPPDQQDWLREQLREPCPAFLIFMHHPPAYVGVPFMDNNYPLQNQDEVMALFRDAAAPVAVFCGHFHVDRHVATPRVSIFCTPSTCIQIDSRYETFRIEHRRIAWREIDLAQGSLRTSVRYFDGFPL